MTSKLPLLEYVAKMRSLFDERKSFNHEINDDEKICFLIEGLNSRYRELVDRFKNYTAEQWNVTSVGNAIITFTIPSAKPTAGANMIVHRNGNKMNYQESQDRKSHDNLGSRLRLSTETNKLVRFPLINNQLINK